MLQSDPSGPTDFKYVGNDCYYPNYEFFPPSHLDLSWKKNGGCYNYSLPVNRERDLDATLEVYPNPAVERIYVRAEWQKGAMIAVVDILGNRVAEYKTNDQSGLLEIDISHLSPGIYVLQFEAAQKLLRKKIIKAF